MPVAKTTKAKMVRVIRIELHVLIKCLKINKYVTAQAQLANIASLGFPFRASFQGF